MRGAGWAGQGTTMAATRAGSDDGVGGGGAWCRTGNYALGASSCKVSVRARVPARVLCELEDPGPPSAMGKGSDGVEEIGLRADGDVQRRRGERTGIGLERSRWRKGGGERFAWQSFRLP